MARADRKVRPIVSDSEGRVVRANDTISTWGEARHKLAALMFGHRAKLWPSLFEKLDSQPAAHPCRDIKSHASAQVRAHPALVAVLLAPNRNGRCRATHSRFWPARLRTSLRKACNVVYLILVACWFQRSVGILVIRIT